MITFFPRNSLIRPIFGLPSFSWETNCRPPRIQKGTYILFNNNNGNSIAFAKRIFHSGSRSLTNIDCNGGTCFLPAPPHWSMERGWPLSMQLKLSHLGLGLGLSWAWQKQIMEKAVHSSRYQSTPHDSGLQHRRLCQNNHLNICVTNVVACCPPEIHGALTDWLCP